MDSQSRLNMEHGFIHHIIRNQVDRDNYDKEVKSSKTYPKKRPDANKSKKPEITTYVPPMRMLQKDDAKNDRILFHFEYEDESGNLWPIDIHQGNDPKAISHKLGSQLNFSPAMKRALTDFLKNEINRST